MKKIISFLLLTAMLVSLLIPAFTASAAGELKVVAADAEYTQGAEGTNVAVTLEDNTAVGYLTVIAYFKTADFPADPAIDLTGSIFDGDTTVGSVVAGTNRSVKSTLEAAGLTAADYSAIVVEFAPTADVTTNGLLFNMFVKPEGAVGATAECGVVVKEALDLAEEDVAFVADADTATVTVKADPYLGKYTDTTIFAAAPEEILPGTETVDVQIRIDANPTIWSTRVFVAYTAGWEITNVKNGGVFPAVAFSSSNYSTNVAMTEEYKYPFSDAFNEYGINAAGKLAAVAFFDPEDPGVAGNVSGNGALLVLTFKVPTDAKVDDKLTVELATITGDTIVAETDAVTALPNPAFVGTTVTITCAHANTRVDTTPATCTEDGKADTVCTDCGTVVSTAVLTAPGHNMVATGEPVVAPTCNEEGYTPAACSVCSEPGKLDIQAATGIHNYSQIVETVDPTCVADGYTLVMCSYCGTTEKQNIQPATGIHTPGEPVVVPADCLVDGSSTTYCTVCNQMIGESTVLPALGHDYQQVGEPVAPTCTEDGYTNYACSRCGEPMVDNIVPALGHNEVVDEQASTCTVAGHKTVSCDRCGEQLSHEDYDLKAHTPGAPGLGKPTCTEDFVQITRCTVCGQIVDETVYPATNHPTREDVEYVYPTCNADGKWVFNCTECGEQNLVEVLPKEDHVSVPSEPVKVDATYDADGSVTITCTDCNEVISTEVLPRLTVELKVEFVDKDGKAVADAVVVKDLYKGDMYEIEANEIDGYKLVGDAKVTVELKETDNVVTFVYEKVAADAKPQAPQTGDAMMFIIIALAVAALGTATVVVIRRNKKEN